MPMLRDFPLLLCFILLALCAIGCGGAATYPVNGQVVYSKDDQPLPGGRIELQLEHEDLIKRANVSTEIDADGRFKLQVLEGKHRVLILPPMPPPNVKNSKPLAPLHQKHRSYDTSGLTIEVGRDVTKNQVKLVVEK